MKSNVKLTDYERRIIRFMGLMNYIKEDDIDEPVILHELCEKGVIYESDGRFLLTEDAPRWARKLRG